MKVWSYMEVSQAKINDVQRKYAVLASHLNEQSRRLWAATEAISYGRGGISLVCQATGISNATVIKGIKEIQNSSTPTSGRIRQVGGGRKQITKTKRGLRKSLISLVEPTAKGDPIKPLQWTSKSTRNLADVLKKQEYIVSHATVGTMLNRLGYSLQVNKKTLEGTSHIDRDAQFFYINYNITNFLTF